MSCRVNTHIRPRPSTSSGNPGIEGNSELRTDSTKTDKFDPGFLFRQIGIESVISAGVVDAIYGGKTVTRSRDGNENGDCPSTNGDRNRRGTDVSPAQKRYEQKAREIIEKEVWRISLEDARLVRDLEMQAKGGKIPKGDSFSDRVWSVAERNATLCVRERANKPSLRRSSGRTGVGSSEFWRREREREKTV